MNPTCRVPYIGILANCQIHASRVDVGLIWACIKQGLNYNHLPPPTAMLTANLASATLAALFLASTGSAKHFTQTEFNVVLEWMSIPSETVSTPGYLEIQSDSKIFLFRLVSLDLVI